MAERYTLNKETLNLFKWCDINPQRIENLTEALTHTSYANEHNLPSNERLEFLGDAVIELITREYLYRINPDLDEGKLTQMKTRIVSRDGLSFLADKIKLGDSILIGGSVLEEDGRDNRKILAQAMESLMGALYISCGYEKCREFFHLILNEYLEKLLSASPVIDPKSRLQMLTQDKYDILPVYYTFEVEGGFASEVFIEDELVGEGKGSSKQDAEMTAARDALKGFETE